MPRWNSFNILQVLPEASCLWQFDGKGNLGREARTSASAPVPPNLAAKSWTSLWKPRLNVAWLPAESVFLRVIELPKSSFDETVSMVELQLEKLSPMPVAQIAWTIHVLAQGSADLQTVIVVIAARSAVEEFLGKLEGRNFLADRLEAPMLDQLGAITTTEDGAWIFPAASGVSLSALVAWCRGGVLRNVSFILLPLEGDRVAHLKNQLEQLVWAAELEGWLGENPNWHLVAEGTTAAEWKILLKQALDEPVAISPPLTPVELAARTARRAAQASPTTTAVLMPAEFSTRYREQFRDRLWLHGLYTAGIIYVIYVAFYFCATTFRGYQAGKLQDQVVSLSDEYTNTIQLKARFAVLQERENLKFAALDSLKLVADNMPDGITLERFSFGGGQAVALYGTASADQIQSLYSFNTTLQNVKVNGKAFFGPGEPLSWRQYQNQVNWNFSLQLLNKE
jgi:hypothetical protein